MSLFPAYSNQKDDQNQKEKQWLQNNSYKSSQPTDYRRHKSSTSKR